MSLNLAAAYPEPVDGVFNVGVLHTGMGGMDGHANYAPCTLDNLVTKGYDYWALGHVHHGVVLHQKPHVVFSGNLQGRHIRETGPIHIVFGPNEAGKSTALSAIEDLLFGIPGNSRYNFLHDYGSMRVGAVLENGGKTLEVRRRKGNKDTLLTADEVPVTGGAGALAPFLAGADQAFFTRMFSLDHERLRNGGREILEAKDEVGQMLFSAGAGLSGLRDRLGVHSCPASHGVSRRPARHVECPAFPARKAPQ